MDLDAAEKAWRLARTAKTEAQERFDRICHAVPEDLIAGYGQTIGTSEPPELPEARTLTGITLKARAMLLCSEAEGSREYFEAGAWFGRDLMENIIAMGGGNG